MMWLANALLAIMLIPTVFEKDLPLLLRTFFVFAFLMNSVAFYNLLTKGCV